MDEDVESDQRLEHHRSPEEFVDLIKLYELTGVEYFKVNVKSNINRACNFLQSDCKCRTLVRFKLRDKNGKCTLMHFSSTFLNLSIINSLKFSMYREIERHEAINT